LGYLQHIHTATERYSIQITDQQKEIWQEQHHRNGIHNQTRQAANAHSNPDPVTFFAFLFPVGTSLKCKSFTIVWARCVLFGSSPACATPQSLPGQLSHGSHAAQKR
jgi:hypothetical protein